MPSRPAGRGASLAIAATLAMAMLAGNAGASPADTQTKISSAERRVAALEGQMASDRARVLSLQTSMRTLASQVDKSRAEYDAIEAQLLTSESQREQVVAQLQGLRDQIDAMAAQAYIQGPSFSLQALLDLKSLSDATDVVDYANAIMGQKVQLAQEARQFADELAARERQQSALKAKSAAVVARVTAQQQALTQQFADEQVRLAQLAQTRVQLASLLAQLRKQLRAEEIAAAEAALASGTPISFGRWAEVLLNYAAYPVARNNLVVLVAWETAEYTSAKWNPLATTYPMPGATTYNGSGVRNYVSLTQGLEATMGTLRQTGLGYEQILADLAHDADPMTTAKAINASMWCSGCANGQYVVDLIPSVEQYYDSYARAGG
jgi:hypothetical protein